MDEKEKRLVKISTEKDLSNWLTMLSITEHSFELSKQQFWDSVRLRYGWEIANLPCESKFDIQHSISCKKGGFVSIRQNDLHDLTARIVSEEEHGRTANRSNEERLEIRAQGFWNRDQ